eukprot:6447234-Prymnesium_polylepis.1
MATSPNMAGRSRGVEEDHRAPPPGARSLAISRTSWSSRIALPLTALPLTALPLTTLPLTTLPLPPSCVALTTCYFLPIHHLLGKGPTTRAAHITTYGTSLLSWREADLH